MKWVVLMDAYLVDMTAASMDTSLVAPKAVM